MNSDTPIGHLYWPNEDAFGIVFHRHVIPSADAPDATPKDNIHDQKIGGGYVDYLYFSELEFRVNNPIFEMWVNEPDEGTDWETTRKMWPHVFECSGACFLCDNHDTIEPDDYARAFASLGYEIGESEGEEEDAESSEEDDDEATEDGDEATEDGGEPLEDADDPSEDAVPVPVPADDSGR